MFDMDGVLIDSMKYHIKSWRRAFGSLGVLLDYNEIALLEGMPSKQIIEDILKRCNIKLKDSEKSRVYSIKRNSMPSVLAYKKYSWVLQFLRFLKSRGVMLGLVSGSNRDFVDKIVLTFFKDIFNVVISGDDTRRGKPNPDPYSKAMRGLGVSPKKVIVIENAPLGIRSAKRAGAKVYALSTTLNKDYLSAADEVFSSHRELFDYMKRHEQLVIG